MRIDCAAMHNPSGRPRIAVVNRWAPWWLSVKDFGKQWVDTLTRQEWETLPPAVQPLYQHLAEGVDDEMQPMNQLRSRAASARVEAGFGDPTGHSNRHIIVPIPRL